MHAAARSLVTHQEAASNVITLFVLFQQTTGGVRLIQENTSVGLDRHRNIESTGKALASSMPTQIERQKMEIRFEHQTSHRHEEAGKSDGSCTFAPLPLGLDEMHRLLLADRRPVVPRNFYGINALFSLFYSKAGSLIDFLCRRKPSYIMYVHSSGLMKNATEG